MSFCKDTKEELCASKIQSIEQKNALTYGMVLFSRMFGTSAISCTTESRPVAMTYSETVSALTGTIVELSVKLTRRRGENSVFTLSVPDKNVCQQIFEYFGHSKDQPSLRINRGNIDGDECLPFFLRGAFMVCGNVTSPEKDYHLEFVVPHKKLADDLQKLISEINELNAEPHIINRKGSYVIYIKGSENIEDMLTYIGAPMSVLDIIQNKMVKSVRNRVNRRINSETANIKKTANASAKQLRAIELIKTKQGLESLPDELRELAQLRIDNPEYNLRELGEALSAPISRSGVNHRLQRIMEIAEGLREK